MTSNPSSAAAPPGAGGGGANLEALAMDKVAEAADSVAAASTAGEVVRAIHAVAVLLFPVDSATVAGEAPNHSPSPPIPSLICVLQRSLTRSLPHALFCCRYRGRALQKPGETPSLSLTHSITIFEVFG
jgi:telomere length regulation protein